MKDKVGNARPGTTPGPAYRKDTTPWSHPDRYRKYDYGPAGLIRKRGSRPSYDNGRFMMATAHNVANFALNTSERIEVKLCWHSDIYRPARYFEESNYFDTAIPSSITLSLPLKVLRSCMPKLLDQRRQCSFALEGGSPASVLVSTKGEGFPCILVASVLDLLRSDRSIIVKYSQGALSFEGSHVAAILKKQSSSRLPCLENLTGDDLVKKGPIHE